MGVTPGEFFRRTFYRSSHEKSIESVANGLADAASVESLIFEGYHKTMRRKIQEFNIHFA